MKKILLAAVLTALTTTAFAADLKPYIEGSFGWSGSADKDILNLLDGSHTINNLTITGGSLKSKSDSTWNVGIELGLKDVFIPGVRLAVSDIYMRPKGQLAGSVSTASTSSSVNEDTGRSSVNVTTANAYYDFKTNSPITPFIGAGIGGYKVNQLSESGMAWSLMAGAKYSLTNNVYVGAKATYMRLEGVKLESGSNLETDDSNAYALNATLGYEF
jgi:opacity protein-like surface antigen